MKQDRPKNLPPFSDYRTTIRGGQLYIVPKVGQSFGGGLTKSIIMWLRDEGYFAAWITENKIAVSETSSSPSIEWVKP